MSDIKKLKEFIDALKQNDLLVEVTGDIDFAVTSITFDSRNVTEGCLFVCKGESFKEEYLLSAVNNGATAFVSEHNYDAINTTGIIVSDIRKAMPIISQTFYGKLSDKLKVIGITGTKGKSTIAYFVKSIFDTYMSEIAGKEIAICSGIRNYDGKVDEESTLTTPENFILCEKMDNAIKSGIEYMVMEVSSQAMKYDRTLGVDFEVACFNNIGRDHVSPCEHPNFEDYFTSKLKIFTQARKACINADSDNLEDIISATKGLYTIQYSTKSNSANIYAFEIKSSQGKTSFKVRGRNIEGCDDFEETIELSTFGLANISNALAAISISILCKIPMKYIKLGLSNVQVPGRMNVFRSVDGSKIGIVDFAHNELSFEALLSSVKTEFPNRDIIIAFGSSGGKAINRRKGMGEVAGKFCKHVILTEDDPANESALDIANEIATHLGNECTYEIVIDREEAVHKLVSMATDNNVVIAAGKSIEKFVKRGNNKVEIESDYEIFYKEFSKEYNNN